MPRKWKLRGAPITRILYAASADLATETLCTQPALSASSLRRRLRTMAASLILCSILITATLTLQFQGNKNVGGARDDVTQRYESLRKNVDAFFGVTNHDR
jgi:hypothetical protein